MIPVNCLFNEFFNDPFFRTASCPFMGTPQISWSGDGSLNRVTDSARKLNPPCCAVVERNKRTVPPPCCAVVERKNMTVPPLCSLARVDTTPSCCFNTSQLANSSLCSGVDTKHTERAVVPNLQVPKPVKGWIPLPAEGARRKQEERPQPVSVFNPITSETRVFHRRRMEPLRVTNPTLTVLRDQDVLATAIQCVPPVFRTASSRSCKPTRRVQPVRREKEPETAAKQNNECESQSEEPGTQWSGFEPHLVSMIEQEVVERDTGVRWEDVAGQEDAKTALREAVVLPTKLPEVFRGARRPWKGVLLVGPPGTGKTLLARAAASECRPCTFFNVSSATLTSRYRGESEKLVRLLFAMAAEKAPSVIFIDEIDALCSDRSEDSEHEASRRFKSELLVQMDGLGTRAEKLVVVLAATNHPWDIDEAFRRRFERRIYVPLPDAEARRELLRVKLRGVSLAEDVDKAAVAARLAGFSGSDVADVCREAAMAPLRRLLAAKGVDQLCALPAEDLQQLPVAAKDLDDALRRCKRTVSRKHVRRLQDWVRKYASS